MKGKSARAHQTDERATSGAIDFDAALEAYLGDPEELLRKEMPRWLPNRGRRSAKQMLHDMG